jgi:hypothetical protein
MVGNIEWRIGQIRCDIISIPVLYFCSVQTWAAFKVIDGLIVKYWKSKAKVCFLLRKASPIYEGLLNCLD